MKLVSLADRIVFSSIKNFEYGQINLKNYYGKEYKLGNENSPLKANLIINKPGVTLNILNKESFFITGYIFLFIKSIIDDFPEPFGPINITFSSYFSFRLKSFTTSYLFLKQLTFFASSQ